MKTRVLCILAAGLLSSGFLFAQQTSTLIVNVPFEFQVGPSIYPAGEYTVAKLPTASPALVLKAVNGAKSGITLGHPDYTRAKAEKPMLVFNRYAGTNFLSEVWGIADSAVRLTQSRTEKEFARRLGRESEGIMVAAKK